MSSPSHFIRNCWPSLLNDKLNKNVNHNRNTRILNRSANMTPCASIPVNSRRRLLFQIIFLHSLDLAQFAKIENEYFCIVKVKVGFDLSRTFSTNDFWRFLMIKWNRVESVQPFKETGPFEENWFVLKRFSLSEVIVWAFTFVLVIELIAIGGIIFYLSSDHENDSQIWINT